MQRFLWLLLCSFINLRPFICHVCLHKAPEREQIKHGVYIESHHSMKKRSVSQKLRIHVHYDSSVDSLPTLKRNLIRDSLIPNAVRYWENTLSVRKTSIPIKLQRQCVGTLVTYKDDDPFPHCVGGCHTETFCGDTLVPSQHLDVCRSSFTGIYGESGDGVADTDFVLYVSAVENHRCDIGSTVAYAAYCQLEATLDRPVAGYVNLCPSSISTHVNDVTQMHSTLKHEMLHALGFSAGLFAFYRDSNGEPLTPRIKATRLPYYNETLKVYQWSDKIIKSVTYNNWKVKSGTISKTVNLMVTPSVQTEVRKHFDCDTLEGAELEDQDVIGTSMSHWEKRLFENEAMTGTYTQNPVISRITLAALHDSGWYNVNYDMAQTLKWGAGLGCDFVVKSCMEWIQHKRNSGLHIHPFCNIVKSNTALHTECTEDRSAVALCNLIEYEEQLDEKYQYFDSIPGVKNEDLTHYGGLVALADYCPYIQEFTWHGSGTDVGTDLRSSQCDLPQTIEDRRNYLLESHSQDSLCFEHSGNWTLQECDRVHIVQNWGSGCYTYKCSSETGLSIMVHGDKYHCFDGKVLHIQIKTSNWLHTGTIVCPSCDEICKSKLEPEKCPETSKLLLKKNELSLTNLSSKNSSHSTSTANEELVIPCINYQTFSTAVQLHQSFSSVSSSLLFTCFYTFCFT